MAGLMAVSVRWKISVHGALAGAGLARLGACGGALWPWALLPLLGWSRVRLGRHTVAQVIAGAAWGVALFGLGLALYGG
jgi:membrane-associated phospholipid phosphatase